MTGGAAYPAVLIVAALTAGAALAEGGVVVPVPSGQHVELHEVLLDESPGETWARFRFLAPQIAESEGGAAYEAAAPDMDHLCNELALPYLEANSLTPARVVISLADRHVPFGSADAEATQFFETYSPEATGCVWEEY